MSDAMPIYRLHSKKCPHKGREESRCRCPLHLDALINGSRFQISLGTRKWGEAEAKAALFIQQKKNPPKSIESALADFGAYNDVRSVTESTRVVYRGVLKAFGVWCKSAGVEYLDQVTLPMLDAWRQFRKHVTIATASKERSALKVFFGFCSTRGWIQDNTVMQTEKIVIPDNEVKPYTEADKMKIMFACERLGKHSYERTRVKAAILVMRYTGLRISDVLMLKRSQVQNGSISVFTQKNHRSVHIKVTDEVIAALDAMELPYGSDPGNPHYFWNQKSSILSMTNSIRRALASVYTKSGVPGAKNHRWRHTFISEQLAAGNGTRVVCDMVGDTEAVLWKSYAKWISERQDRVDEAQDRFLAFQQKRNAAAEMLLNLDARKPS